MRLHYIDVTLDDVFGVGLDKESLEDPEPEIELFKIGEDKEEIPSSDFGIGVDGKAEHMGGNIWRYYFSGSFEPGQVYVRIKGDSYQDNAGNKPLEQVQTFNVYSNAFSFQLIISGAAELYGAVESLKLVSVKGEAKLDVQHRRRRPHTGAAGSEWSGRRDVFWHSWCRFRSVYL
ncbi:MAG UNVERIFIED_CONTAM: hypothetical protein LVR18_51660 [Planctomycetaceae bacterium]|jgi:hypothetical protein